jgi:hypothetical protein
MVVYGHTPTPISNGSTTRSASTLAAYSGKLTALLSGTRIGPGAGCSVYMEPVRPLVVPVHGQQAADAILDIEDVQGKRTIVTRLAGSVRVEPENAAAALEVMSRFAIDPRWLVYLPPTMSPPETSARPSLLEHPDEALDLSTRRDPKARGRGSTWEVVWSSCLAAMLTLRGNGSAYGTEKPV